MCNVFNIVQLDQQGILPRAALHLFALMESTQQKDKEVKTDTHIPWPKKITIDKDPTIEEVLMLKKKSVIGNADFCCSISFVELYNDEFKDLMATEI
eukprot:Pgem_evm1s9707